jgi:hypothetical protein
MTISQDAFSDLALVLAQDADDDVQRTSEGLTVKGRLFSYLSRKGSLVVDLPLHRADDLIGRGAAASATGSLPAKGKWVAILESEDWSELAAESHQFVGEPAVGGQSSSPV